MLIKIYFQFVSFIKPFRHTMTNVHNFNFFSLEINNQLAVLSAELSAFAGGAFCRSRQALIYKDGGIGNRPAKPKYEKNKQNQ